MKSIAAKTSLKHDVCTFNEYNYKLMPSLGDDRIYGISRIMKLFPLFLIRLM
jgi:hypothetical protein